MCEFKEVRLCLEVTDRNNNMRKTTIVEINGHRFVREQRYEQLEQAAREMYEHLHTPQLKSVYGRVLKALGVEV